MEACADECIRVRASFKSPVDKELNYNLEPEKDVFSRIFLEPQNQTAGQDQMVKTEQEVDRAILECGRMQAVANAFGQITFYYDGKQILKEEWIDETCDMPPYQKARDFQGAGGKSSRIRAYFHANSTEHLYGMGQENRDCLDLKGCTVDLCQKNTKCTIPFYISTLVMDSFGITRRSEGLNLPETGSYGRHRWHASWIMSWSEGEVHAESWNIIRL